MTNQKYFATFNLNSKEKIYRKIVKFPPVSFVAMMIGRNYYFRLSIFPFKYPIIQSLLLEVLSGGLKEFSRVSFLNRCAVCTAYYKPRVHLRVFLPLFAFRCDDCVCFCRINLQKKKWLPFQRI